MDSNVDITANGISFQTIIKVMTGHAWSIEVFPNHEEFKTLIIKLRMIIKN